MITQLSRTIVAMVTNRLDFTADDGFEVAQAVVITAVGIFLTMAIYAILTTGVTQIINNAMSLVSP